MGGGLCRGTFGGGDIRPGAVYAEYGEVSSGRWFYGGGGAVAFLSGGVPGEGTLAVGGVCVGGTSVCGDLVVLRANGEIWVVCGADSGVFAADGFIFGGGAVGDGKQKRGFSRGVSYSGGCFNYGHGGVGYGPASGYSYSFCGGNGIGVLSFVFEYQSADVVEYPCSLLCGVVWSRGAGPGVGGFGRRQLDSGRWAGVGDSGDSDAGAGVEVCQFADGTGVGVFNGFCRDGEDVRSWSGGGGDCVFCCAGEIASSVAAMGDSLYSGLGGCFAGGEVYCGAGTVRGIDSLIEQCKPAGGAKNGHLVCGTFRKFVNHRRR